MTFLSKSPLGKLSDRECYAFQTSILITLAQSTYKFLSIYTSLYLHSSSQSRFLFLTLSLSQFLNRISIYVDLSRKALRPGTLCLPDLCPDHSGSEYLSINLYLYVSLSSLSHIVYSSQSLFLFLTLFLPHCISITRKALRPGTLCLSDLYPDHPGSEYQFQQEGHQLSQFISLVSLGMN